VPVPEMKQRDLLLLIIVECAESPEFGRTSLQKVAYFVGEGLHKEFNHRPHFYGPFSDYVEDEVLALVASGLVEETTESLAFVSGSGFAARRYRYSVAEGGLARIKELKAAYPEETVEITTFLTKLSQAAGGFDQGVLSSAAKTYYLAKREGVPLSFPQIQSLGKELGWELTRAQVSRVVGTLKALGFVETK
jgi:uncharacterized protein YwgA